MDEQDIVRAHRITKYLEIEKVNAKQCTKSRNKLLPAISQKYKIGPVGSKRSKHSILETATGWKMWEILRVSFHKFQTKSMSLV